MSFLKNLFGSGSPARRDDKYFTYRVKYSRCGEIIKGRVDLDNDLSLNDEENGCLVRKGLMGGARCFQQIDVELKFDMSRQLIEKNISGGEFIE
jgi:hypothetical protein